MVYGLFDCPRKQFYVVEFVSAVERLALNTMQSVMAFLAERYCCKIRVSASN
jgi:hypothetical protein